MKSFNPFKGSKHRIALAIAGLDRTGAKAQRLQDLLEAMEGVWSAYINVPAEVVYVVYDPRQVIPEDLNQVVRELGLEVEFVQYAQQKNFQDNPQGG